MKISNVGSSTARAVIAMSSCADSVGSSAREPRPIPLKTCPTRSFALWTGISRNALPSSRSKPNTSSPAIGIPAIRAVPGASIPACLELRLDLTGCQPEGWHGGPGATPQALQGGLANRGTRQDGPGPGASGQQADVGDVLANRLDDEVADLRQARVLDKLVEAHLGGVLCRLQQVALEPGLSEPGDLIDTEHLADGVGRREQAGLRSVSAARDGTGECAVAPAHARTVGERIERRHAVLADRLHHRVGFAPGDGVIDELANTGGT